jgi:hypothetical protein
VKYNPIGVKYRVITNDVSNYINLLVRLAHIICNHPIFQVLDVIAAQKVGHFPFYEVIYIS